MGYGGTGGTRWDWRQERDMLASMGMSGASMGTAAAAYDAYARGGYDPLAWGTGRWGWDAAPTPDPVFDGAPPKPMPQQRRQRRRGRRGGTRAQPTSHERAPQPQPEQRQPQHREPQPQQRQMAQVAPEQRRRAALLAVKHARAIASGSVLDGGYEATITLATDRALRLHTPPLELGLSGVTSTAASRPRLLVTGCVSPHAQHHGAQIRLAQRVIDACTESAPTDAALHACDQMAAALINVAALLASLRACGMPGRVTAYLLDNDNNDCEGAYAIHVTSDGPHVTCYHCMEQGERDWRTVVAESQHRQRVQTALRHGEPVFVAHAGGRTQGPGQGQGRRQHEKGRNA